MKKLTVLFLLLSTVLSAQIGTLDLGKRGKLTLFLGDGWKVETTDMAGTATLIVKPTGEANASMTLAVTSPDVDRFDTKARLKLRVEADGYTIAERSVERKSIAKEFTLTAGYGFYCSFTDPDLRGQPPRAGEYKVMTMGKIRLSPEILIDVQIMADDFRGEPYNQLLGAIEGMEFKAK